jgi:hypothetical protein
MKMLPHLEVRSEREARWQRGATKLGTLVDAAFLNDVIGLGRLDCSLRESMPDLIAFHASAEVGEAAGGMPDYFYLLKLWLFGGYELARTLEERLPSDHPCKDRARQLKIDFERARVPLAKLQRARRFPTDFERSNQMVYSIADGPAWQVAESDFIFRDKLADQFLELLDALPEPPPPVGSGMKE